MEKKVRIYEMGQGQADNVEVIDKLTLVVHSIDKWAPEVIFVANPNLVEYHASQKSQSIGFEFINGTRLVRRTPNSEPVEIEADGTVYTVVVDSIGTARNARRRAFCDFVVSWGK